MKYYSAIERIKICHLQQCGWTWRVLSEISQTERKILYVIPYTWNLKIKQINKCNNKENPHRYSNNLVLTSGERQGWRGKIEV